MCSSDLMLAEASTDASAELGARTWGERNVLLYQHPLSAALPLLGRWLDMPRLSLPGDAYTIRVQSGVLGASVMGTSGSRNPTLTVQALAWRTAEHLAKNWGTIAG